MIDPGLYEERKQTLGDVGPWPGRLGAQEFDWRETAPSGTDLVGGSGTGIGLAGLLGSQKPFKINADWQAGRAADESVLNNVTAWLRGLGKRPQEPELIFRGVPKGTAVEIKEPYTHATPWLFEAMRGGKGGFGDPRAHDVYAFKAKPNQLYYRGGSLAGDPYETTRINTIEGAPWNEVLEFTKGLHAKQDTQVQRAVKNATFETDVLNRPGIWRGYEAPPALIKERPRLRSIDEIIDILNGRVQSGMSTNEALATPEGKILQSSDFLSKWLKQ